MKRLPPKLRDGLIFLGLLITVPCFIYYISMNFGDQRVHIEKKQWNPAEAADEGIDPQLLKEAADYIETRLPMARGMVIIKNGRTVHEKYYWKGGPQEKEYLHSLNGPILHALVGIAIDRKLLTGPDQSLEDFFPDYFRSGPGQDGVSPTVADLLQVKAPLLWGEKTAEYWKLFFGGNRIEAAIRTLFPAVTPPSPAAAFAAHYLLAEVLQQASSMSVFAFAHQHLFAPLGITTVTETKKTDGLLNPFTGFQLRTLDLAKFGYLVMHNGMWQKNRIIPAAWTRTITGISATPPGGG
ncbi:MAG: serine hydrolase, partial [Deltaproteobacteria bacterium]|nr:serine hydrolase [Deltaproteobacteria bacterium]